MILSINKPSGLTSFDVVKKIRKITNEKKVGHGGTLDPFAEGVLIIAIGRQSTKKLNEFLFSNKEYNATLKLGVETDTLDLDGTVIKSKKIPKISKNDINNVLDEFIGNINQNTPIYSARKISGVRLYKYARKNIPIKTPINKIRIFELDLISFKNKLISFKVKCSKGTYIRQLAYDIAKKLGTTGHLVSLTRTKVGEFTLENSNKLIDFEKKWVATGN
ncbi:MAG: tRNA pseudouridine(55) synthase TruB [Candidatus Marinimicrobia bacterium]|nr:tRNA pseudouridine(55) synthase TruB [Candidatus Neomarinimicrobiota bacterium]